MTVSSGISSVSYSGNGATTGFSYTFKIFADSDLVVSLRDNATGVSTTQTLTTDYTVSGAGTNSGGTVTFVTAPASGKTVIIRRELPFTQETDYVENDPFPAQAHEDALDKLTMLTQQIDSKELNAFYTVDSFTQGSAGTQTTFALSIAPASKTIVQVFIDGVYQQKANYNISNTNLVFTTAPPANSGIEVLVGQAVSGVINEAAGVQITDAGNYYTASNVEAALQETAQSQNIVYAPAGTGAVQTTVQAKLRESVSVKDFGFDGTGGTDNTAKFNTMLAALSGSESVTVRFPAGQYHFASKPNNISSSVKFVGDGISNTRLFRDFACASDGEGLFNFVGGANGSSISQMSIESNGAPGGATGCLISLIASASDAPDFCRFSDLYLTSNSTDAYKIFIDGSLRTGSPSGVRDTFISNCSIFGGGNGGVYAKSVVSFHMTSCDTFPAGGVSGKIVITGITGNKSNYVNIDGAYLNGLLLEELNFGNFNAAIFSANITNASTADTIIVQGSLGATVTVQNFWSNSIFLSNTGTPNNFLVGGKARGNILQVTDGVTAPATEVGFSSIYVDTADGDLKIKFGDGTVKTIVTDT